MPVFRNVPSIRRSRRLSNRPPPADPEYEDYDLEELQLPYPSQPIARSSSASSATHIAPPSPPSPSTPEPHSDAEGDRDAAAYLPPRVSHGRRRKEGHIPRPRNSFMFFRSDLCRSGRIRERDHRQISRIAGHLWRKMPEELKMPFHHLAAIEKQQHKELYPGYKYAPTYKTKSGKKRTRKDSGYEAKHCRQLAELLIGGVQGDALALAALQMDAAVEVPQVGPQRSTRSRRAAHRETAPYHPAPRPSRRAANTSRASTSTLIDADTVVGSGAASPAVKPETEATPHISHSHDSFVPIADIPTLSLGGSAEQSQELSFGLFQSTHSYYPPEMQPGMDVFAMAFPSPSSSTTTITPEMPAQFDIFHDSEFHNGSDGVAFTSPWDDSSSSPPDHYNLNAFGNGDLSPLSYPQHNDDLLSQYLNEEYTL